MDEYGEKFLFSERFMMQFLLYMESWKQFLDNLEKNMKQKTKHKKHPINA